MSERFHTHCNLSLHVSLGWPLQFSETKIILGPPESAFSPLPISRQAHVQYWRPFMGFLPVE